jgi:hypothetical protein
MKGEGGALKGGSEGVGKWRVKGGGMKGEGPE